MDKYHNHLRNLQYPEDKYYLQLRNVPIGDVFDFSQIDDESQGDEGSHERSHYLFDEFLEALRFKGIPVSTPEWLHFMKIIKKRTQEEHILTFGNFFDLLRIYAQTTLVKDKSNYALFHEVFDDYFMRIKKLFDLEGIVDQKQPVIQEARKNIQDAIKNNSTKNLLNSERKTNDGSVDQRKNDKKTNEGVLDDLKQQLQNSDQNIENQKKNMPKKTIQTNPDEIKDSLGIKDVNENLNVPNEEHEDLEQQHGGNDQHNDILQKIDKSKSGGGEEKKSQQDGKNNGGGNLKFTKSVDMKHQVQTSFLSEEKIKDIKKQAKKVDVRNKYEKRPDKTSMREVIRALRKIIISTSEIKSGKLDIKQSVKNISKKNYSFEYLHEKTKPQELVLFIDVGGPVDTWRPIIDEVTESMTKGLSKLEVYLFHNNLYGYVWPYDKKNQSNYAKPNGLLNVKDIVKHRKKVIIYGDAEMSESEVYDDMRVPSDNDQKINQYGIGGEACLNYIKNKSNSVVWLNPIFKKQWQEADDSGSISQISSIIPMYDLTIGGIEDATSFLMRK